MSNNVVENNKQIILKEKTLDKIVKDFVFKEDLENDKTYTIKFTAKQANPNELLLSVITPSENKIIDEIVLKDKIPKII